jgi:Ni/Fe-hydrogenase 1 B-type cytochrome subunit
MRRRIYVWEVPVRLTHWVNVISIVILSFTGYYIGNPYITASPNEPYGLYFMGLMRYAHFVVAFIFVISLAVRTYWAFAGNAWASWRGLFPFIWGECRGNMREALRFYLFRRRHPPDVIGHNALAGPTYMVIVFLYFLQIITGFALYGQVHPGGFWWNLTSWIFILVSNQTMRLVHHLIMYLLIAFAILHIYSSWLVDSAEGNGTMSSIFSGFKFIHCDQGPDCIQRSRIAPVQAVTETEEQVT